MQRSRFSYGEYLDLEQIATVKHEFFGGYVWAMAGGTPDHARVAANVIALLGAALRGKPCSAFSSDLRVRVRATGLATYPDVSVICRRLETDPEDPRRQTAVNPIVLVEVLSASTEDYDRGEKLGHYKQIPTVQEVVLIAHDRREVEIVRREPDGTWSREIAGDGGMVPLRSLGCELPVAEVYRDPLAA